MLTSVSPISGLSFPLRLASGLSWNCSFHGGWDWTIQREERERVCWYSLQEPAKASISNPFFNSSLQLHSFELWRDSLVQTRSVYVTTKAKWLHIGESTGYLYLHKEMWGGLALWESSWPGHHSPDPVLHIMELNVVVTGSLFRWSHSNIFYKKKGRGAEVIITASEEPMHLKGKHLKSRRANQCDTLWWLLFPIRTWSIIHPSETSCLISQPCSRIPKDYKSEIPAQPGDNTETLR